MKKIISITTIFILLLLFSSSVYAQGTVNETYSIYAAIFQGGEFYAADSANVTIYTPNASVFINNEEMTEFAIGRFIYNFTPNEIGNWFATATFYNSTGGAIASSSDDFFISETLDPLTEERLNMIFETLIIFLVGLGLLGIAKYVDNILYIFASGVWFLGAAAAGVTFLNSSIPEVTFFMIIGLATVYHGISDYVHNIKKNKRFGVEN